MYFSSFVDSQTDFITTLRFQARTRALERTNKQLEAANNTLEADLLRSDELTRTLRNDAEALKACQVEITRLKVGCLCFIHRKSH